MTPASVQQASAGRRLMGLLARWLVWWPASALAVIPLYAAFAGAERFVGRWSLDLAGHLWTGWNASLGDPTRSSLIAWPDGVDLMPILGGWGDVLLMGALVSLGVPLIAAWNIVVGLLYALAGWGGVALARALGAGRLGAVVAGLLLQMDGWTLSNMHGGRTEQAALGAVALALAGALAIWRSDGRAQVIWTGCFGALVVWLSWEHAVWLVVAMAFLMPAVLRAGGADGGPRRWVQAAGVTTLLSGPWVALFLTRALSVRSPHEGLDTTVMALENSATLMGWLVGGASARPALVLFVAIFALPFVVRQRDRPLWIGGVLLALGVLLLGLGPRPGLRQVGDLNITGPYALFQHVPVLGWFHTPQRLLVVWSLLVPVSCGLVVTAVRAKMGRGLGWVAALFAAFTAFEHAYSTDLLPLPVRTLKADAIQQAVAEVPGQGVLLDLPAVDPGEHAVAYQTAQMFHGRPIPYHATLPMLTTTSRDKVMGLSKIVASASVGRTLPTGESFDVELRRLRAAGVRFLVVHTRFVPSAVRDDLGRELSRTLGEPLVKSQGRWLWDLGTADAGGGD